MGAHDDIPLGRIYEVDLNTKAIMTYFNYMKEVSHEKEMIQTSDGRWFPTELLRINNNTTMKDYSRKCMVCGAAVRNINPKTRTCDPICTRARNNGLTRTEQIKLDLIKDEQSEQERDKN